MSEENGTPSDLDNALEVVRIFPDTAAEMIVNLRGMAVAWKGSAETAWTQNEQLVQMVKTLLKEQTELLNSARPGRVRPWHKPRCNFGRKQKRFWQANRR